MTTSRHYKSRSGFTLTELLVAITVLAILAGFLGSALLGVFGTAKETAVIAEMKQIELALEQFKNDYGFYPPVIDTTAADGAEIQTPGQFLQYLSRISPQHAENNLAAKFPNTPAAETRFQTWWINVGSQLDETTSLQFWLSGLCKNKQFPLTGGVSVDTNNDGTPSASVMTICGFGDDTYSDGTPLPNGLLVDRQDYFEFKQEQLTPVAGINGLPESSAFGAVYVQPYGASDGDLRYRYLDYKSYLLGDGMTPRAYCDGLISPGVPNFVSPKKFQLITFGRDGLPGDPGDIANALAGPDASDNLCNFVQGRLDTYANK